MIKLMDWGQRMRYEEPRPIYLNKDNIGGMIERHEEDGDFTEIYTKEERPAGFLVKETPEEILVMPDIEEGIKTIDWEQRRYEIAKHVLPRVFAFGEPKYSAIYAVSYADALIEELKKGGNK